MVRQATYGKSVSLSMQNIDIIEGYQKKTRKNFSQTLNIVLQEWDKFSIMIMRLKQQQQVENMKKAEIINPMEDKSKIEMKKGKVKE